MDKATRLEIEIGRYVDGEMTQAERTAMERRLEAEPELRRIADELQALRPHVAEAVSAAAGSIEGERIWRHVVEGITPAKRSPLEAFLGGLRFFLYPRMAAAVAAVAVLIGLYILIGNLTGPEAVAGPIVTDVEYGDNQDVVVVVDHDASSGTVVVSIDGIDTSEVN
jgi:anti-sigma factor RsiW